MKSAPVQNPSIVASHPSASRTGIGLLICFLLIRLSVSAQVGADSIPENAASPHPDYQKRKWTIAGVSATIYAGSFVALNEAWYKGYPKTSFHTFDDSREWLQVDKLGHGWTAYNIAKYSTEMWKWAGLTDRKATLVGGISGAGYLTVIEFLDAHSSRWGWSWSDMAANVTGSGIFVAQQLAWEEQRVQFKFSFHPVGYPDAMTETRADDLFGKSWYERMLKDYNGQTYWFSANIKSFLPQSKIPAWLNIAIGYGGEGMLGGFENKWMDESGGEFTRYDIPRNRQFYLAPDIDFTKIKTRRKGVRTLLHLLNMLKCPSPALMLDSKGKVKVYAIYF